MTAAAYTVVSRPKDNIPSSRADTGLATSPRASPCPVPLGAAPRPECPGGERRSHCGAQGPRWSLLLLGTLTERSLLPADCRLCPGALGIADITTYSRTHTHIHTSMHSLTYTLTHTCTHACIHTHSCTHLHSHTHACTHTHVHSHMHSYTLAYALIYTHARTHTHSLTRTHSHTHRHSHTHTHKIFTVFCSSSSLSQSWPEGLDRETGKPENPALPDCVHF